MTAVMAKSSLPLVQRARLVLKVPAFVRLGIIALLIVAWEVLARLFGDPMFVCPPSAVVIDGTSIFRDPMVLRAFQSTLFQVIVAFTLSALIGLILGLVIGLRRFLRLSLFPIVVL